jgi:hypothetical protein
VRNPGSLKVKFGESISAKIRETKRGKTFGEPRCGGPGSSEVGSPGSLEVNI